MADYIAKSLSKREKRRKTLYWDISTADALDIFCVHHRGWNASTYSEAAVLEKMERDRQAETKPVDMVMRHK